MNMNVNIFIQIFLALIALNACVARRTSDHHRPPPPDSDKPEDITDDDLNKVRDTLDKFRPNERGIPPKTTDESVEKFELLG